MSTYTATSWAEVQTAFNSASQAGDVVFLDFATASATSQASWTAPANAVLIGRGTTAVGGGDQTVITDNYASSSPILNITINATGHFRMTGITIASGTGSQKDPTMRITGPGKVRIDHCRWNMTEFNNYKAIELYRGVFGVMDNCILDFAVGGAAVYLRNGRMGEDDIQGNLEWSFATDFGGENYFFFEDNIVNGGESATLPGYYTTRLYDGYSASKVVVRFNTLVNCNLGETHSTGHGHGSDDRGLRSQEVYGNSITSAGGDPQPNYGAVTLYTGTALVWGNSWNNVFKNLCVLQVIRKDDGTYRQAAPPDSWGYAAGTPRSGTVNVSSDGLTVTKASGDDFNTSWPAGTMIQIAGASINNGGGSYQYGRIASVSSTTTLTLQNASSAGAQTGVAYVVGSNWDGNTDVLGYPAIDQAGRGQGDLLTGGFPSKVNSTTGTVAWPNQALEPVYIWNNTGSPVAGWGDLVFNDSAAGGRIVIDRDYYAQVSGIQTTASSPFNGTKGGASGSVGWGTLANRPTTATTGVAYWATDQGDWNQSTSNGGVNMAGADGVLYVATATNTWTLYYEPYTYPHPLRNEAPASGGVQVTNPRKRRPNRVSRSIRISGRR